MVKTKTHKTETMKTFDPKTDYTGWRATEKLDGINAYFDGSKYVSRNGLPLAPLERSSFPASPCHGEIWAGRGGFQTVQSEIQAGQFHKALFVPYSSLPHNVMGCNEDAIWAMQEIVAMGGEGIVLTNPKTGDQVKLKPQFDDEAEIVGYEQGKGKLAGKLATLVCKWQGLTIRLSSGIDDDMRSRPPAIGQLVTFSYAGVTGSGQPRHAKVIRVRQYA